MDTNIRLRDPVAYPTEPDTTIEIGDRVRCFDFPNEAGCYFIGYVTDVDHTNGQYNVKVEFQVWEGERALVNYCDRIMPPINGLEGIFGKFRGVQRVLEGEEL